jgi:uncharacterized protein YdaU (DUF1376 family)
VEAIQWFKVYPAETLSDELFMGWSVEERGAWFTLILHNWREGSIPADQGTLARILHVDGGTMRSLWSAIGSRFVELPGSPGRLTSPRVEREREAAQRQMDQKKEAGKKGATSRWSKEKGKHGSRIGPPSDRTATAIANDGDKQSKEEQRDLASAPAADAPRDLPPRVRAFRNALSEALGKTRPMPIAAAERVWDVCAELDLILAAHDSTESVVAACVTHALGAGVAPKSVAWFVQFLRELGPPEGPPAEHVEPTPIHLLPAVEFEN